MMTHFQEALAESQRNLGLICEDEAKEKARREGMDS